MIKVLFICHGNICRSPMAEMIMKDYVNKQGLNQQFIIASAATSSEEIWNGQGNPIYPPAKQELINNGIAVDNSKRAIQVKKTDYDSYDYLICMDQKNVSNLLRILGDDPLNKVMMLRKEPVDDPWYSGDFHKAYCDIKTGIEELFKKGVF